MLNLKKFFYSHQPEATAQVADPEPVIIREDFTIPNVGQMPVYELLQTLRDRTCDFALENGLTTATTEFSYIDDLPVIVELTENYDILYTINRFKTFSFLEAVAIISDVIEF